MLVSHGALLFLVFDCGLDTAGDSHLKWRDRMVALGECELHRPAQLSISRALHHLMANPKHATETPDVEKFPAEPSNSRLGLLVVLFNGLVNGALQRRALLDEYAKFAASIDYYEQQAVPEAGMIIDQATRSYKAGAMDYLEYIITLNRALDIRRNYLEALNSYNQTIISIDYITGKIF